MMDKSIMVKAVLLDLNEKVIEISERVWKSSDLGEIAQAYREMARLCESTDEVLKELELAE